MRDARDRARSRLRAGGRRSEAGRTPVGLIVCGAVFTLLVAAKLLFPARTAGLLSAVERLIGQSADFKGAVEAMGRAVSGESAVSDSLQDAYAAVFSPADAAREESGGEAEQDAAGAPAETSETASAAPESLRGSATARLPAAVRADEAPAAVPAAGAEEETAPADTESASAGALSYAFARAALPENASLEQRNLGFEHVSPLVGTLSSAFGWREHPLEGEEKFHYGVDLAAPEGTDVCAFAAGTVYAAGESSSLGNYVMLEHPGGYVTLYAHCSRITVSGGEVAMGEKIAEVGSTGLATGPHLHFELHDGALYLNPIYYVALG